MAFQKGNKANPKGQIRDKVWYNALRSALHDIDPTTKRKNLLMIADAVIAAAKAGDMTAAKEIGDRMDGKPQQAPDDIGGEDNPFNVAFKWSQP
jgi:uncharacterized membrane protein